MDGEKIEVSMDGKKVIKVKDSEIEKGQIALITEQRLPLTVIDDFVVRPMQKKGFFSKITDKDEGTEAQRHKELQASSKKAASLRLQDSSYMPNSQRVKWQDSSQGTGPNPENDYETYNFELETLNHKLSNSSTPEPVLHVLPFSPISHFSPEPDPLYQTTSSLPPSELVYYYHHDHLGNIRAVTDQNRNVAERHDFYPFGEEITTPQSKDQYLFTGKPRDSETGLDYFGARYYSSSLSRWMSPDKNQEIKQRIKEPQEWNLYVYSANNPLKYKDPSGKFKVYAVGAYYNPASGGYEEYWYKFRFTSFAEPIKTTISLGLNFVNVGGPLSTISTIIDIISWGSRLISTVANSEPPGWIKYEPNFKSFMNAVLLEMKTDPEVEKKFNEMFKKDIEKYGTILVSEQDAQKFLKEIQEKFPEIKDLYDWDNLLEQAIKHLESSPFERFLDWIWSGPSKERSTYEY